MVAQAVDPVQLLERLNGRPDQLHQPAVHSLVDLMDTVFPPTRWIIPEMIAMGLTILVRRPETRQIVAGAPDCPRHCLRWASTGQDRCQQAGVLLLALEDTQRRLQGRAAYCSARKRHQRAPLRYRVALAPERW